MTKKLLPLVLTVMFSSVLITGCSQGAKTQNSKEAIEAAKVIESVEAQAKYLVSEANAFINSQQFDDAIKTAQYVLANIDANSTAAQSILDKAKAEMEKMAMKKAEEAKTALKKKLGQ